MQNLSFSVNSKLTELTELSTRVDMLTKPHGNRNRRALPSSGADQSSLFKGTVCEENVTRIQESRRIKTSLRDRLLQARARPLLTCTEEPASGASREW